MNIINFDTYQLMSEKIIDFVTSGLSWKNNNSLETSFNERFNKLMKEFGKLERSNLKASFKTLFLQKMNYEKAVLYLIIWRYTRKDGLVIETKPGNKIFFESQISTRKIKEELS